MKRSLFVACLMGAAGTGFSQNWLVTGNAGLTSANFLGTTDAVSLTFKTNNQRSGYIDFAAAKANTALGFQALNVVTGANNAAFGYKASALNTTGANNTSAGAYALYGTTVGYSNVAIGIGAMYRNLKGSNSVAVGDSALYNHRTSLGYDGPGNTAIGSKSQYTNDIGHDNTSVGFQSLYSNTGGHENTAIGGYALFSSTGCFGCSGGSYNTAIGYNSLYANNADGYGNTATGTYTMTSVTSGRWLSGFGYGTNVNNGAYMFSTALGAFAAITAGNQVRIGDNSVTSIGGYANWSNISDVRVKKNIKQNVPGLAFINKLQPITYNLDLEAADQLTGTSAETEKGAKVDQAVKDRAASIKAKEKVVYTGFAAQEVEKAAKSLGFDFSGVDAPKNGKDLYALRYSDFVVPLVKAVQELSSQNDLLQTKNDDLQNQINELKALVMANLTNNTNSTTANQAVTVTGSMLEQNIPNPFSNTTSIGYTLPQQYSTAQIVIADKSGKAIKTVKLSGSGKGRISVNASTLSSGAYTYTLYVDNKVVESKQMVLQK